MRLLLTGAQGFIGRYVAAAWLRAGGTVLGTGRSPERPVTFTHAVHSTGVRQDAPLPADLAAELDVPGWHYAPVDLFDPPALVALLQGFRPDVVVHLAGALRSAPHADQVSTNVTGTANLLEAVEGSGIPSPRFVLASTGSVYGDRPEPAVESDPTAPSNTYSISKVAAELTATNTCARAGIPLVVARIFNVTGPGADERHAAGRFASRIVEMESGRVPPHLETGPLVAVRDYLDVRDCADALVTLGRMDDPPAVVNVASGVAVSIRTLLDTLLDASPATIAVEERDGHPGVAVNTADASLLRGIGVTPRPLAESVADLLEWHRGLTRPQPAAARPEVRFEVVARRVDRYPVVVRAGLMGELPDRLLALRPNARMAVLTDERVCGLHGLALADALRSRGVHLSLHVMDEGEASKSPASHRRLVAELRHNGFDRRALLVCLGGGLVSDVGGYIAATYLRGVDYVNVPTTLLAQHDAAIGGKVAVNTPWAKNFVGAFHHPAAVWADPTVLSTLHPRDVSAGVAEAVKVGMCGAPDLLELLEREATAIARDRDPILMGEVVAQAGQRKAELLDPDPYETDLRRVLNLGHAFAHPLETELGYEGIRHGEAVGFGLAVAIEVARARGTCDGPTCDRLLSLLDRYDLPPRVAPESLRRALGRLQDIRLVRGSHLHYVLPTGFGSVTTVRELAEDELPAAVSAVTRAQLVAA